MAKLKNIIPHYRLYLVLLICLTIITNGCNSRRVEIRDSNPGFESKQDSLFSQIEKLHLNRKLRSINEIIGDSIDNINKKAILFVSGYDCGGCVFKSLNFFKVLVKLEIPAFIILSPETNINDFKIANNLNFNVYIDFDNLINNELPSNFTPVLIGLNAENKIISEIHIANSDTDCEIAKKGEIFIKELL